MRMIGFSFLLIGLVGGASVSSADIGPGMAEFDAWCRSLDADPVDGSIRLLRPPTHAEIDARARLKYHLLPGLSGFESARLRRVGETAARLEYSYLSRGKTYQGRINLSESTLRLTRLHIWLCDLYYAEFKTGLQLRDGGDALRHTALRFASQARYDLVVEILEDLAAHYADTEAARWAEAYLPGIRGILRDHRTLIWDQTTGLGSGSNDLRFFGSYYGLWLGFAIPMALEADSPEPYGLGLILGGPSGYLLADRIARAIPISEGRATILSLGGNLGTWQGLGWAGEGDAEASDVVASGIVGGLGGLGAAIWLSHVHDFSEGHASLCESAMNWGAWYGLVLTGMHDANDSRPLRNALIGSVLGVGVTGVLARNVQMTEKQVRLISLKGILGSVMGMGVAMVARPDDGSVAWGIIGAGGAAGLYIGFRGTNRSGNAESDFKDSSSRSDGPGLPRLMSHTDLCRPGRVMPALGYQIRF